VKYRVSDDGGDPSRNQALTQQLVEEHGAIAIVYSDNPFSSEASQAYLNKKQVPSIGNEGAATYCYTSEMCFPQTSTGDAYSKGAIYGMTSAALARGLSKVGTVSCVESTFCSRIYDLAPSIVPDTGTTLAFRGQGSLVQPDYTAICQNAKGAGAEALLIALDQNSLTRLIRSCHRVQYTPLIAGYSVALTAQADPSDPALDGVVLGVPTAPWFGNTNPLREYRSVLERFSPGSRPGANSLMGWISAKLFERAAQRIGTVPTAANVLEGLWSIKNEDLGGLTYPMTFVRGQQTKPAITCYWIVEVVDKEWSSPNGHKRTCV
jgi:branched-chain amino acid transport system substrate-binding protein